MKLIELFHFELTYVGDKNNLFYVINAIIISTPNRNQALSGIDKFSFKEDLNGNKKFSSIVSAYDDYPINTLVKWNDILNGRQNRMMILVK